MIKINQIIVRIKKRIYYHFWQFLCLIKPQAIISFKLIDGLTFEYPLKSVIGQGLFLNSFEKSEIEFVRKSLKEGDVFFDIGANGGFYTIIAAKQVGSTGHVFAFEPGLRELSLLHRNIEINNLSNVTIIKQAVTNRKGTTKFGVSRDGAMNSLSKTNHPEQQIEEWQTVKTISIDEFMQEFNIPKINFIKIDVEGAEKLVLEGAKKLLSANRNITILFEASDLTSSSFGYSVKDFLQDIVVSGLSVYHLDKEGNLKDVSIDNADIGKNIYNFIACS